MTITHKNDLAEMGRMLAIISDLRAELAAAQEQNAKLKAALKPFADAANSVSEETTPNHLQFYATNQTGHPLTIGDLRNARAALQ